MAECVFLNKGAEHNSSYLVKEYQENKMKLDFAPDKITDEIFMSFDYKNKIITIYNDPPPIIADIARIKNQNKEQNERIRRLEEENKSLKKKMEEKEIFCELHSSGLDSEMKYKWKVTLISPKGKEVFEIQESKLYPKKKGKYLITGTIHVFPKGLTYKKDHLFIDLEKNGNRTIRVHNYHSNSNNAQKWGYISFSKVLEFDSDNNDYFSLKLDIGPEVRKPSFSPAYFAVYFRYLSE